MFKYTIHIVSLKYYYYNVLRIAIYSVLFLHSSIIFAKVEVLP